LGTFLLFSGIHFAALLDKSHPFMQDLRNYATEPMDNGPDGGLTACGGEAFAAGASSTDSRGLACLRWADAGFLNRECFIPIPPFASPLVSKLRGGEPKLVLYKRSRSGEIATIEALTLFYLAGFAKRIFFANSSGTDWQDQCERCEHTWVPRQGSIAAFRQKHPDR
jgi:hypothetical protein